MSFVVDFTEEKFHIFLRVRCIFLMRSFKVSIQFLFFLFRELLSFL